MFTDYQSATYDLSFWIAMSTPNIMQNANLTHGFLCSDFRVADGAIRSAMYAGLSVYISLPGSPGSSMLSFYLRG